MSRLSRWWRNRAKGWVLKLIPPFAEKLDASVDAWLDKAQADGDVDKVAKELIQDILPNGVVEDVAVSSYQEFGSKLLHKFIDDLQEEIITPQAIEELAKKAVDKI
jgi:hypothetical protein